MVALEIDIHDSVVVMRTVVLVLVAEIDNQNLDIAYASTIRLASYSDDVVPLLVVDNEVAVTAIDTYHFDDLPKGSAVDNASPFEVSYDFDCSIVAAVALAELVVAPVALIAFDTVVLEHYFDDSAIGN